MRELIDIGLNLTHDSFDRDRREVLERARAAGVARAIVTGTTVTASVRAVELAESFAGLYATVGIHPHHASEFDAHSRAALEPLLAHERVVAVGECGLDFFRDFSPRDAQAEAFDAQLAMAADSGLPVFLHQRDAHDEFVRQIAAARDRLSGGVAHCFTGGPAEARSYLDLDLYIGITGWICDERRGEALRSAVADIPLDRLLLETDSPYLLPRDLKAPPRDRRNEPSHLPHVLARVAAETGRAPEEIAEASTANADRLFRLQGYRQPSP